MEESLSALLLASSGVTTLVGTGVYWSTRPQASALPAAVLQTISAVPIDSDEGDSGLVSSRVQIDCWAVSALGAKQVARAIKDVLSGKAAQHSGTEFQGFFTEDERESVEEATGGSLIYRTSLDFIVWWHAA